MDKLTEAMTTKVTSDVAELFMRLAAVDGLSASELLRSLIDAHIHKKQDEFILLQRAFTKQGLPQQQG